MSVLTKVMLEPGETFVITAAVTLLSVTSNDGLAPQVRIDWASAEDLSGGHVDVEGGAQIGQFTDHCGYLREVFQERNTSRFYYFVGGEEDEEDVPAYSAARVATAEKAPTQHR